MGWRRWPSWKRYLQPSQPFRCNQPQLIAWLQSHETARAVWQSHSQIPGPQKETEQNKIISKRCVGVIYITSIDNPLFHQHPYSHHRLEVLNSFHGAKTKISMGLPPSRGSRMDATFLASAASGGCLHSLTCDTFHLQSQHRTATPISSLMSTASSLTQTPNSTASVFHLKDTGFPALISHLNIIRLTTSILSSTLTTPLS